jgi:hypothetical protein
MRYWMESIRIRYWIEIGFFLAIAISFKYYINSYGTDLLKFRTETSKLREMVKEGAANIDVQRDEIYQIVETAYPRMITSLYLAWTTFTHPVQHIFTHLFVSFTKRKWSYQIIHYFDYAQALAVLGWTYYYYYMSYFAVPNAERWSDLISIEETAHPNYTTFLMNAAD